MSDREPDQTTGEPRPEWWQPAAEPASSPHQFAAPAPAAPGWTPPPKPGLIPLRPLGLGDILGASFKVLRHNPRPLLGFAILAQVVVAVVTSGIVALITWYSITRVSTAEPEDRDLILAGVVLVGILAALIPIVLSFVIMALLQGIVVIDVGRSALGEKLTLRGLLSRAKGRAWALVRWWLLIMVAVTVIIAVIAVIVFALVATLGAAVGGVLSVFVTLTLGLAIAVLAAWLTTKLSLVPSALMLERVTVFAAIRRSWSLTGGYFWRTFGIQLLVGVILSFAAQIVSAPFSFITPIVTAIIDPTGQGSTTTVVVIAALTVLTLAVSIILGAVTTVVQSANYGVMYLDLRMRKEAFDVELTRFVEERGAGRTTGDDPFVTTPPGTPNGRADATSQPVPPMTHSPWA